MTEGRRDHLFAALCACSLYLLPDDFSLRYAYLEIPRIAYFGRIDIGKSFPVI